MNGGKTELLFSIAKEMTSNSRPSMVIYVKLEQQQRLSECLSVPSSTTGITLLKQLRKQSQIGL